MTLRFFEVGVGLFLLGFEVLKVTYFTDLGYLRQLSELPASSSHGQTSPTAATAVLCSPDRIDSNSSVSLVLESAIFIP